MGKRPPQEQKIPESPLKKTSVSCDVTTLPDSHCCAILESIGEGVFAVDLNKKITYLNPAAETITGFEARKAIGQYCFDIFRASICEAECPMDAVFASGDRQLTPRAFIISKSGYQKPISIVTSLLRDYDGKIIGGLEIFRDLSDLEKLRRELARSFTLEDIVGKHSKIREILSFLPDIAESESPVLIEGPTGSGKELIARAVHSLSPCKNGPFIAVNCAALPDTLLESELFGYAKGAFTGAVQKKSGRFLSAHNGTLFLDEIANTSPMFQGKLLRVLEDGEFMPLGETKPVKANFRMVSATNLKLKELVREDKFREDLYYRINVAKISLPSLKERKADIPFLIDHFIHKFNILKGRIVEGVTSDVLSFLMDYSFPGNIRELENVIEYAYIPCKGRIIRIEHLPKDLIDELSGQNINLSKVYTTFEHEEAEKIRVLLDQQGCSRQEAAKALRISRTTLWRKMKKYGLTK